MGILRRLFVKPFDLMVKRYFPRLLRKYVPDVLLYQPLVFGEKSKLKIAPTASVSNTFFNLQSGTITIEDYAFCGQNVCMLTGAHDYSKTGFERQKAIPQSGRDILIKKGAWIASNVIIIGPCVIGENSVISAGCLINKDVPPNVICYSENHIIMKELNQKIPNLKTNQNSTHLST
jgi:acetyltransferase-like isoleucine patch superfamily enzyme